MTTPAPYEFDHALKMARQAIDYAEQTGDFTKVRQWINEVQRAHDEEKKERPTTAIHFVTSATTNQF